MHFLRINLDPSEVLFLNHHNLVTVPMQKMLPQKFMELQGSGLNVPLLLPLLTLDLKVLQVGCFNKKVSNKT